MQLINRLRARVKRENLPGILGALTAFLIMFAHPLIYDNFFFNINRFKFAVFGVSVVILFIIYLSLCALKRGALTGNTYAPFRLTLADAGMAAFLIIALISTALSDDPYSAVTGDEGRMSGLGYMLLLGFVYVMVSRAPGAVTCAVAGLLISGALASALGILNFFYIDPLGFSDRLSDEDFMRFISTIGNINFFGAYLNLVLPAAAVMAMRGKPGQRAFGCITACLSAGAVIAVRTESAMLAPISTIVICLWFAAPSRRARARMCLALSAMFAGFALVGALCAMYPGAHMPLGGNLCAILANRPLLMGAMALVLCAAAYAINRAPAREYPLSGRAWKRALAIILLSAILALLLAFAYYTFIDTQTPLSGARRFLRYNDKWGTNRGGVWVYSMRLYAESGARVQLVGFGPDCLKAPLAEAYGDEIAAYCNLSFDNAHNEYIQYLLTLGALGLIAYMAFALGGLKALARKRRDNAFAACALAAACAYLLQAAVNVNQPITTPLLFALLSAGAGMRDAQA